MRARSLATRLMFLTLAVGGCSDDLDRPIIRRPADAWVAPQPGLRARLTEPPVLPPPAADAAARLEAAKRCFGDPLCPAEEASRLYVAAADAGADVSCWFYWTGEGVSVDLERARRCFERSVSQKTCDGSSPSLDRLGLASMLIEGLGGPAGPARADRLFDDCFEDFSVEEIRRYARTRTDREPETREDRGCWLYAMTTVHMHMCSSVDLMAAERALELLAKEQRFAGTPTAIAAFAATRRALANYAEAQARWMADLYRGGTISGLSYAATLVGEREDMAERLSSKVSEVLPDTSQSRVVDSARARRRAYQAAYQQHDAERRMLLAQAERAFTAYRTADVALHVATSPELPHDDVRRARESELDTMRAHEIASGLEP